MRTYKKVHSYYELYYYNILYYVSYTQIIYRNPHIVDKIDKIADIYRYWKYIESNNFTKRKIQ